MKNFAPHTGGDVKAMLKEAGVSSIDELFHDIPASMLLTEPMNLPRAMPEPELAAHMKELASRNEAGKYISFLGAGTYDHYVPAIVKHMLQRSEFYTSYTPYQAEISQGTLQSIFEFQTMICELTGMDAANASMYDGATATAEGAVMALRHTRKNKVLVSGTVHPEYRQVLNTYLAGLDAEVVEIPASGGVTPPEELEKLLDSNTGCVIIQNPNFFGQIEDGPALGEIVGKEKPLFLVCADPVSLAIMKAPGDYGADIVTGDAQGLGNSMYYGGPHVGFFAVKEKYMRKMPGRVVGQTVDTDGKRGFVLTMQAREQHIRRKKATSNICSNEALCALASTIYLGWLGKSGFQKLAALCISRASYAYEKLTALNGIEPVFNGSFFKEFVIKPGREPAEVNRYLLENNIIGGLDLGHYYPQLKGAMLFCVTESRSREDIDYLVDRMGEL